MPFSPKINTRPLVGAAIATCSRSCRMMRLSPTILPARSTRARKRAVFRLEVALPQRVADDEHRLLERQRLLDEVERAHLDRLDRRLDVAVPGDHHDLRIDFHLPQAAERRETVQPGQPHVEHDDVEHLADDAIEALLAALDGVDV